MENKIGNTLSAGAKIGTITGAILFLFFGLLPGIYFGGTSAVVLISSITDGPVEPGVLSKAAIVFGVLIGSFGALAVFLVAGALIGTLLGYLADTFMPSKKAPPEEKEEAAIEESEKHENP